MRSNLGAMPENSNKNNWIKSGCYTGESKTKGRDGIWARCQRIRNKRKGSNLGAMTEKSNQNEGIEPGLEAEEPEIKGRAKSERNAREPESKGRDQI